MGTIILFFFLFFLLSIDDVCKVRKVNFVDDLLWMGGAADIVLKQSWQVRETSVLEYLIPVRLLSLSASNYPYQVNFRR